MELNDEHLDYPDCIVPRENNSIPTPERIQKLIDECEAKRAAREKGLNSPETLQAPE